MPRLLAIAASLVFFLAGQSIARAETEFVALCYHDIQDAPRNTRNGMFGVKTADLIVQFEWLRENGYHPVSLDDLLAARDNHRALPDKPVLLTFDDGYTSFYTRVFPLLKLFNYPAVLALVGHWQETPADGSVSYAELALPRTDFIGWDAVKEMAGSGLVEIASHTFDLHRGITANPYENVQPAATTRLYDLATGTYEDDARYEKRIRDDLTHSIEVIQANTGIKVRALVWPYGAHNAVADKIAADLGLGITLTLDVGKNDVAGFQSIKRVLVANNTDIADFAWIMRPRPKPAPVRVAHVDLDYVFDDNKAQQNKNLDHLLDRIKDLQINTVYLQAYADPDGDGVANALYFPNRHLPMREDLFNRVAWQLRTRAGVQVYAWMPVLAYDSAGIENLKDAEVTAVNPPQENQPQQQHRLSPFNSKAVEYIGDMYEDLAKHADFAGLLFHDDAFLTDYEDNSPAALQAYRNAGLPDSIEALRKNPALMAQWTTKKSAALVAATHRYAERARLYRPSLKTARNIYARVIQEPDAEAWFAQSLPLFLANYDYTAIMAMPFLDGTEQSPRSWLKELVAKTLTYDGARARAVFELQTEDWDQKRPLRSDFVAGQMRLLKEAGVVSFGYYPDDFVDNRPALGEIRPQISLSTFPYKQ